MSEPAETRDRGAGPGLLSSADVPYRRPPTAQEAVLQAIRGAILRRDLKPGQPIRQDAIASEFEVSRVPVREALKVLEAEGQITYEPHRGFRVANLSLAELEELYLLRALLETEAMRRAIPNLTSSDLGELVSYIEKMDKTVAAPNLDIAEFLAVNERFHFAIFERSELPRLVHFIRVLWRNTDPYRNVSFNEPDPRFLAQHEHHELLEACQAGHVETAVEVINRHREGTIATLRVLLHEDTENNA